MASTYSSTLGLELMANGENSSTWGTKTNNNLSPLLETAIAGYTAVNFATDANTTVSINNGATSTGRYLLLNLTSSGSLTATRDLICPLNSGKWYMVFNNTTGAQSIRVKGATGTGVTIPNGKRALVYTDGVNYGSPVTYFPDSVSYGTDLAVTGNTTLTGTLGVTGATTVTGNIAVRSTQRSWGSNIGAVQVGDAGAIFGSSANQAVSAAANLYYDGANYVRIATGRGTLYTANVGQHVWYTTTSGTAGTNASPTVVMQTDTSSNLLVGAVSVTGSRTVTALAVAGGFRTSTDIVGVGTGGSSITVTGFQPNSTYIVSASASGAGGEFSTAAYVQTGSVNVIAGVGNLSSFTYTGGVLQGNVATIGGAGAFSFDPANSGKCQINVTNGTGGSIDVTIVCTRVG